MTVLAIFIAVVLLIIFMLLFIMMRSHKHYMERQGESYSKTIEKGAADVEDLVRNTVNLPYSNSLNLILHQRLLRLYRLLDRSIANRDYHDEIAYEKHIIGTIRSADRERLDFTPPEDSQQALDQLKVIRNLRQIVSDEVKRNMDIDPVGCSDELHRLFALALKIDVSTLLNRCHRYHEKGNYDRCLDLINKCTEILDSDHDQDLWFDSRRSELRKMQKAVEKEKKEADRERELTLDPDYRSPEAAAAGPAVAAEAGHSAEVNALFGEKLKW